MIDFDDIDDAAAEVLAAGGDLGDAAMALGSPDPPRAYKGGILPLIPRSMRVPGTSELPEKVRKLQVEVEETAFPRTPLIRLFVFYGAGDSCAFWAQFAAEAPQWVEVATCEWPSHGIRPEEEHPFHVDKLVDDLMIGLTPALEQHATGGRIEGAPFALIGHSIGALVMVGIGQRARAKLGIEPAAVFVLDRAAPHLPICSEFGAKIMAEDGVRFISLFYPPVFQAAQKDKNKEAALQMWVDDIRLQEHTKPEGFHIFRCPMHVFIAMENFGDVNTTGMDTETRKLLELSSAILSSKKGSHAPWDRPRYDEWRRWTVGGCHMHEIDANHIGIKGNKRMREILWETLDELKVSPMASEAQSYVNVTKV